MRVKALITFVDGPSQLVRFAGEVFDVPDEIASGWLRANFVGRMEPEVQTATRAVPEVAVTRKGRR